MTLKRSLARKGDSGLAFFVHSNAKNREAFRLVLLLHLDEPGNFDVARIAPGGPEIDEHDGAFVLGEGDVSAVEVLEGDGGSRLDVAFCAGLLGV